MSDEPEGGPAVPIFPWPLVAVAGPTGTGKSRVALHLAERLRGEIVNADSRQIYRGLDIGTAKPSPGERAAVPHHLFDIAAPEEIFSAGQYQRAADAAIADIAARGRQPVLAGGTGFYLRALLEGLFDEGNVTSYWKKKVREALARRGPERMHRLLARVDPEAAGRIMPRDGQRIVRALEVYFSTGEPLTRHHARQRMQPRYACVWVGLKLSREMHRKALEERFDQMIRGGWLEEVKRLMETYPPEAKAWEAHGYREAARYLRNPVPEAFAAFREEVLAVQQRYARRQMTWFRAVPGMEWFDAAEPGVEERVAAYMEEKLNGLKELRS